MLLQEMKVVLWTPTTMIVHVDQQLPVHHGNKGELPSENRRDKILVDQAVPFAAGLVCTAVSRADYQRGLYPVNCKYQGVARFAGERASLEHMTAGRKQGLVVQHKDSRFVVLESLDCSARKQEQILGLELHELH